MKVIFCKVGCELEVSEIAESMTDIQRLVGGYIAALPLKVQNKKYFLIYDEDANRKGKAPNKHVKFEEENLVVLGNFCICKIEDGVFRGLSDAEIETILSADVIGGVVDD